MKIAAMIAIGVGVVAVGLAVVFGARKLAAVGRTSTAAVEDAEIEEEGAEV